MPTKPVAIVDNDSEDIRFDDGKSAAERYTYSVLPPLPNPLSSAFGNNGDLVGTSHFRLLTVMPGAPSDPIKGRLTTCDIEVGEDRG